MAEDEVRQQRRVSPAEAVRGAPPGGREAAGGGEGTIEGGADAAGTPVAVEGSESSPEQIEQAALVSASLEHPFGPGFFYSRLRSYALDHCPDPAAGLPVVEIHLADGDVLDLCHIIGVTPQWVAVAVRDEHGSAERMRTEFVPYGSIFRVTLRSARPEAPQLGFEHARVPGVFGAPARADMTPEAAVRVAAAIKKEEQE